MVACRAEHGRNQFKRQKNSKNLQIDRIPPNSTVSFNNLLSWPVKILYIFARDILESQQHWPFKTNKRIHKEHTSEEPETTLTPFYFGVNSSLSDVKTPSEG